MGHKGRGGRHHDPPKCRHGAGCPKKTTCKFSHPKDTGSVFSGGSQAFGGAPSQTNPFGGAPSQTNLFGGASSQTNPFGAPSQTSAFGPPQASYHASPGPFGTQPQTDLFGGNTGLRESSMDLRMSGPSGQNPFNSQANGAQNIVSGSTTPFAGFGQGSGTSVQPPIASSSHFLFQSAFSPAPQSGASSGCPIHPSQRTTISFLDKGAPTPAASAPAVVIPIGVNMDEVDETYPHLTRLDVLRYQADNFKCQFYLLVEISVNLPVVSSKVVP